MDEMGRTEEQDVLEWFTACRDHGGLEDIRIYGVIHGAAVRALGTDPVSGQKIHLLLNSMADPGEEFDFVEATDEFDEDRWIEPGGPDMFAGLLTLVRDGDPDYWSRARDLLEGLQRTVNGILFDELEDAAAKTADRLERTLAAAVEDQAGNVLLAEFKAACERRAPHVDYLEVHVNSVVPKKPPSVSFGHGPERPNGVRYYISPLGQLHLNGVTAFADDFEEVLAETYSDPWALLGARNAARDLLAIQSAAAKLREIEQERILKAYPAADVSEVVLPGEAQAYLDALFSTRKTGGSHV